MSDILIYTSPARGHLYPIMDTALALQASGHHVTIQTLPEEREAVTSAGIEHRSISPAVSSLNLTDYVGSNPLSQLRRTLACWAQRAPHEVLDLRTSCAISPPDLLLVDANCWGAAAFAESLPGPWAMFLPYVLPVPSPANPRVRPWLRAAAQRRRPDARQARMGGPA